MGKTLQLAIGKNISSQIVFVLFDGGGQIGSSFLGGCIKVHPETDVREPVLPTNITDKPAHQIRKFHSGTHMMTETTQPILQARRRRRDARITWKSDAPQSRSLIAT